MMLPDELEWVLQMLGYRWPTANEDKLRDCATMWRDFGDTVTELHTKANGSARQVLAHNAGESIDKFTKTYEKFDGGGGSDGYLRNAAQAAYLIANVLEACAYLVEFAKWAVIAQLIALAIEIAAAHAAAPFTFGLSEVAGLGATQVTRLIVRRLLDELKQAMIDALIETMKEPAISAVEAMISDLIRQTVNVGFGAQEGYDIGATMKAGGEAGLDALRQSPQTFAEGVRDSLGQKAGSRARDAIDSRLDGYDGPSGLSGGDIGGDGVSGKDGGSDSGSGSSNSSSSDSSSSDSPSSNSSSSDTSSSGADSSTSTRSGSGPGVNIGGGISADTGGNDIGAPDVGPGPGPGSGSGSGSGSDSGSPSSSDSPYSRPTPSLSGPSLSDFDDPSSGGASPGGADSNGSSGTPSTSGPSHSGNGNPVSGLSSPSPQSAPTPASSGGTSSSPGGGSIGTQIDGLAASAPTQSNAAPTPTTADPSPAGTGGRSDGGSAMPTSPMAPSTGGPAPGTHHAPSASGGTQSATSPNPNSGPARNAPVGTPGTPSTTGTGPASTPSPTASSTTPRTAPSSTPSQTPDPRISGSDGRTPGTADSRVPNQSTPGTSPGDRTPPRNTPGTTPGDRTPSRDTPGTTPGDRTPSRDTPGTTPGDRTPPRDSTGSTPSDRTPNRDNTNTTPGDRTPPRNNADPTGARTPGQNPSQTTPNQNTAQSSPPRTPSPSPTTPTTPPSTSPNNNPDRASTPSNNAQSPSPQHGRAHAPDTSPTPSTPHQPSAGTGSTPPRPHQPAGNTPNTPPNPNPHPNPNPNPNPTAPQQPAAQPHKPESTPSDRDRQNQQQQVTVVPIHTVVTTPGSSQSPSHADPATPQHPGSPQATPSDSNQNHPQQDSLDDIRADLDHQPGGLSQPDPADQQALVDAVPHNEDGTPQRFPDPFGPWAQLQNDGGNTVPGRSNNCADCSRSFLETWYGNPQVSAPRTVDLDENGKHNPFTPEDNANDNQIRWTGAAHTYAGPGGDPDTANTIASTLQQAGPGSAAIVQVDWPGGGGHAFNVVNHNGKIVWIDTQSGEVSDKPLHIDKAAHVWHIPLDADRNPIDTSQSDDKGSEDSKSQNDEAQDQKGDASQPENSEDNGQPHNDQNPQNDASGDTPKQGDDTDTGTADQATPDDQSPEASSEQHRPSPAERPSTPDPQSLPNEATRPDEEGRAAEESRAADKESQQPTATTESQSRPDAISEHRQPPVHTASDNPGDGTPDKATTPTRPATDALNDPTTNRDTRQQTTTPSDPRTSIPQQRTMDPRTADPRTTDPRTSDPRTSDPYRDTSTQKKPETHERSEHLGDPRSETPDKDRFEAPDQTRPEGPSPSPTSDHRNRADNTVKDSAVPTRENLPDGRTADAAGYVKDSVDGKKPLYGDIADEGATDTARSDSEDASPPRGPAEPGAGNNEDKKAFIRRMVDFANESRENREKYWRKDGQRLSLDDRVDGKELPQLKRDPDYPDDPDKFIAASDVPPPVQPDYMPEETHPPVSLGRNDGVVTPENLAALDAETNDREWTLQADRITESVKLQAKEDHGEDSEEYKAAKRVYADTHSAVRDIGESHGEMAALHHAMATEHPEYVLVDIPRTGNGSDQFDQIYEDPNNPGHYIVVEAKAPSGQLGPRTGHSGQKVMQGTREYFETIYMLMQEGTPEQKAIADKLETAYELGNVQYVLVQSKVEPDPEANEAANNGNTEGGYVGDEGPRERKRYGGVSMEYFDIRKPEDRQE
ncbi:toxin glutamine deamidase domain-containing protein [Streptomyces curacoi]|uniref:Uncharacterized protein n=1 Tax=Streptomyces curacoi TaxID=146536 RepID=A0A117NUP8_9ACTN|nr:toxin glutamine deamidase domain-containing protein [Streptomyces curacoi]KUM67690.1 hypothetical protein AQI70_35090 [Streptomyces curacoi]